MRYLLDTHAILWGIDKTANKLSQTAREIISDPKNEIYVSAVSLWEITIKVVLGKLDISLVEMLEELKKAGFVVLQINNAYLQKLLDLPSIHKDPFDRLIISAALAEDLTIITIDENIQKYDVSWIW